MSSNPGGGKSGGRAAIPAAPTQFGVESVKSPDITGSLDFTALIAAKPALKAQRAPSASAAQMQKVRELALRNRALRLDFSKLQGADGPGCRVLVDLLQATRRAGVDLVLNGESMLLGALARVTRAGAKDVDPGLWLLRLEVLQAEGRQEEFDALALDYAVTYEVSPPTFEPLAPRPGASPSAPVPATPSPGAHEEEIALPAEVAGGVDGLMQRIDLAAALQDRVTLDCARTSRIDVAAAGAPRPLAERSASGGKPIEIRHPNALVSALLEATGVTAHAKVLERS